MAVFFNKVNLNDKYIKYIIEEFCPIKYIEDHLEQIPIIEECKCNEKCISIINNNPKYPINDNEPNYVLSIIAKEYDNGDNNFDDGYLLFGPSNNIISIHKKYSYVLHKAYVVHILIRQNYMEQTMNIMFDKLRSI